VGTQATIYEKHQSHFRFLTMCMIFFFFALYRAIQTDSSNETVRYWNLRVETNHKCVFDSVNPNIHSITFKLDSSFVVTIKSAIFTDIAITMMFFSSMFSFPLRVETVRHYLLLDAFQGTVLFQKETSGLSDNFISQVLGCISTSSTLTTYTLTYPKII